MNLAVSVMPAPAAGTVSGQAPAAQKGKDDFAAELSRASSGDSGSCISKTGPAASKGKGLAEKSGADGTDTEQTDKKTDTATEAQTETLAALAGLGVVVLTGLAAMLQQTAGHAHGTGAPVAATASTATDSAAAASGGAAVNPAEEQSASAEGPVSALAPLGRADAGGRQTAAQAAQTDTVPADITSIPAMASAAADTKAAPAQQKIPQGTQQQRAAPDSGTAEKNTDLSDTGSSSQIPQTFAADIQSVSSTSAQSSLLAGTDTQGRTAVSAATKDTQLKTAKSTGQATVTAAATASGTEQADGKSAGAGSGTSRESSGESGRSPGKSDKTAAAPVAETAGAQSVFHTVSAAKTEGTETGAKETRSVVSQTSEAVAQAASQGRSEVRIHLSPENLGGVNIRLVSQNGAVSVRITADDEQTGRMLAGSLHELSSSIQQQGVTVQKTEVFCSGGGTDTGGSRQFEGGSGDAGGNGAQRWTLLSPQTDESQPQTAQNLSTGTMNVQA